MAEIEDIVDQFRAINSKTKKRFMRRMNLSEPVEQFNALSLHCERNDLPQYAGLCCTAVVNCENSLKNLPGAVVASNNGGNQFVNAHKSTSSLGCYSPSDEYLQAALHSYTRISSFVKGHTLESALSTSALSIGGHILEENENYEEAALWMQKSVSKNEDSSAKIISLEIMISQMIKTKNYVGALYKCSELIETLPKCSNANVHVDIASDAEITTVLLLLVLKPNPRKLPTMFSDLLEKYTWIENSQDYIKSTLCPKVFYLMQSLVMSCQAKGTENLDAIEKELVPYLNEDQTNLLIMLMREHRFK